LRYQHIPPEPPKTLQDYSPLVKNKALEVGGCSFVLRDPAVPALRPPRSVARGQRGTDPEGEAGLRRRGTAESRGFSSVRAYCWPQGREGVEESGRAQHKLDTNDAEADRASGKAEGGVVGGHDEGSGRLLAPECGRCKVDGIERAQGHR